MLIEVFNQLLWARSNNEANTCVTQPSESSIPGEQLTPSTPVSVGDGLEAPSLPEIAFSQDTQDIVGSLQTQPTLESLFQTVSQLDPEALLKLRTLIDELSEVHNKQGSTPLKAVANQEQIDEEQLDHNPFTLLKQGVEVWNKWREKNSEIKLDLGGVDLSGANLECVDLSGADLRGAYFRGAHLREANLYMADLVGANFEETCLRGANLQGADCYKANFRKADLGEANLAQVNIRRADLVEATLEGANLSQADLLQANLMQANLHKANLYRATLEGTNLIEANLEGVDLLEVNLSKANIRRAKLHNTSFKGAILKGAILPNGIMHS